MKCPFARDCLLPDEGMKTAGRLADSAGQIIGVGPGRCMGLMFVAMGTLAVLTAVSAFLYPRLRRVETELPDAVA